MRTSFILSTVFLAAATTASFAITACSADSKESSAEAEIQQSNLRGEEGASCSASDECKPGLLCKGPSSGPPPGAVGLPLPSEAEQSGPPPGAVGLPLPPAGKTCQKPAPGEEGGKCDQYTPCDPGLYCHYDDGGGTSSSGGPPPGAVGLPLPPDESSGPPPGAVGLPLPPSGICKPSSTGSSSSGGPPPGAVGLPLPPND